MAESEYRRLTCGACLGEFTQAGRGRNAHKCTDCRKPPQPAPRMEQRPEKPAKSPKPQKLPKAPKPAPSTECKHCGEEIEKPRRGKMYCSTRCALRARDGTTMDRAEYRQRCRAEAVVGKFTCEHCGIEAYRGLGGANRKKGITNRFCSMACRKAQAAEREALERARRGLLVTLRLLGRKKAAPECSRYYNGYTPAVRACVHCGLQWSALSQMGPTTYCPTPDCQEARAAAKRSVKRRSRPGSRSHVHRAKRLGRRYRYFNPLRVLDRDGWRCQICGVRTPRKLRGTLDPRAPELDHILPLAAGGDHVPENCQCACRKCNGLKGAKPMGQMLLVG